MKSGDSFSRSRQNSAETESDFAFIGDAWIFVAIERNTKLVLAYDLGKRTVTAATRFMRKLAIATGEEQRFQLTIDGLAAYNYAVGTQLGDRVDYAQLIKIYKFNEPEAQRRYSPNGENDARRKV